MKLLYSEKATKFCEIFTLLFTVCTVVKSKVKFSQNFVTFSEYMNFTVDAAIILATYYYSNKTYIYVYYYHVNASASFFTASTVHIAFVSSQR